MPLKRCQKNGIDGWKYGDQGTCYTGSGAKKKAIRQGVAIGGGTLEESIEAVAMTGRLTENELNELKAEFGMSERITENVNGSKPYAIDRDAGIIRNVKILGRESQKGRRYSDQAFRDAVQLYEGMKVNIDHPPRDNPQLERSYRDGFGELRDCRMIVGNSDLSEGVYGDLHYNRRHEQAERVVEDAERFPRQFGLSHNADGQIDWNADTPTVESLMFVESVDLVGRPATNRGIFESRGNETMPNERKTKKTTLRKIVEAADKSTEKTWLLEQMDGGAVEAEMPVEVEPEMNSDEQMKKAIEEMIVAAFRDESLDTAATIKKIREILKAHEKLSAKPAPSANDAGGEGGDGEAGGGSEMAESIAKLNRKLELMEARETAVKLLGEAGIPADDTKIKALAAVDEGDRESLIESWQGSGRSAEDVGGFGPRPKRTGSALRESEDGESVGSYSDAVKGGFAKALS